MVCVSEERKDGEWGEREGEGTQALSLSSGTHRIQNSLAEHAGRLPVVELREPRNLSIVYYESLKQELKTKAIYEFRCDERLKTKVEESTRLVYTRLFVELEHLTIETKLIDEMFTSVMGEYVFLM